MAPKTVEGSSTLSNRFLSVYAEFFYSQEMSHDIALLRLFSLLKMILLHTVDYNLLLPCPLTR